jgi:hypothetical protein
MICLRHATSYTGVVVDIRNRRMRAVRMHAYSIQHNCPPDFASALAEAVVAGRL